MKKQLLITGMAILLLAVTLSGCTAPSNGTEDHTGRGFDSASTFKLLSCVYYPDENKVLISVEKSSSDSFSCHIVDENGSIGYGRIDNLEKATYIKLSGTVDSSIIYGLIAETYPISKVVYTAGLQFQEDGSVNIVDWNIPYSPVFKLMSWEQIFDEDVFYLGVSIRFEYSNDVSFHILDPKGIEVAAERVSFTESKAVIYFRYDSFDAELFNQTLKLVATSGYWFDEEIIYEKEIQLNNTVSLSIIDADFNWEEYHWNNLDKFKVGSFNFTIKNNGDFPIYSGDYVYGHRLPNVDNHFRVIFFGREYEFYIGGYVPSHNKIISFGSIEPSEEITTTVFLGLYNHKILVDRPGVYNITMTLDYYNSTTSLTTMTKVGSVS